MPYHVKRGGQIPQVQIQGGYREVYYSSPDVPAVVPTDVSFIERCTTIKEFLEELLSDEDLFPRKNIIASLLKLTQYRAYVDSVELTKQTDLHIITSSNYLGAQITDYDAIKFVTLFKTLSPRYQFMTVFTALLDYYSLVCLEQSDERVKKEFETCFDFIFQTSSHSCFSFFFKPPLPEFRFQPFERYRNACDFFIHEYIRRDSLPFRQKLFTAEEKTQITARLQSYRKTWITLNASR